MNRFGICLPETKQILKETEMTLETPTDEMIFHIFTCMKSKAGPFPYRWRGGLKWYWCHSIKGIMIKNRHVYEQPWRLKEDMDDKIN